MGKCFKDVHRKWFFKHFLLQIVEYDLISKQIYDLIFFN